MKVQETKKNVTTLDVFVDRSSRGKFEDPYTKMMEDVSS
jgi:hypothetical protein